MNSNGGFTLIELILVTVIIGILAGMVVINYGGFQQDAKIRAAKGDIATLGQAIDLYVLQNDDQYPQSLQELAQPDRSGRVYVKELKNDPWNNPYNYIPATSARKADYKIYSSGPDGVEGNEDDVTSSSEI